MYPAPSPPDRAEAPLFADGLGERVVAADASSGELLEILRLRPSLTAVPSFEFALRERTARLMNFRHAYYASVRRVDRIQANGTLAVVSDQVEGTRLSDVLRVAQERNLQLDTNAALCLIRQLVPAVALLHENARDASHGLIAPERVILTPHARLVVVEHVLGSAIEQLQATREQLWQQFRVAMPASAGVARFDHRADVNGIGITALSLVLGRPLTAEEFPHAIPGLLMEARERTPIGDERPLSNALRTWLARTLQLDVRRAYASAPEALAALEETLASDTSYLPAPVALETFLAEYAAAMLEPAAAAPSRDHGTPAGPAAAAPRLLTPPSDPMATERERRIPPAPLDLARPSPEPRGLPTIDELIQVADLPVLRDPRLAPVEVSVSSSGLGSPATEGSLSVASLSEGQRELDDSPDGDSGDAGAADWQRQAPPRRPRRGIHAAVAIVLLIGGALGWKFYGASAPTPGTLIVQSSPPGVELFVDGVSRGTTPTRISLAAGSHILELRGRGIPRVIPVQLTAGGEVSQYLEFADTPLTGMLVVHSQPAGATVLVDGTARGTAPITLDNLQPGDHDVVLQSEHGSSRHVVKVLAGTTASLVAPAAVAPQQAEGPVSGWISVQAPFAIEIREDGQLLGTTDTDRVMMAAGRHTLELVNASLGFRQQRVVQVPPGKVASIPIDLPNGTVNLNAAPWAEVWVDGKRIGDTPIGNLAVPIGPHEILFRHPELGEKRHAVSVTTAAPVRLSVSMK